MAHSLNGSIIYNVKIQDKFSELQVTFDKIIVLTINKLRYEYISHNTIENDLVNILVRSGSWQV